MKFGQWHSRNQGRLRREAISRIAPGHSTPRQRSALRVDWNRRGVQKRSAACEKLAQRAGARRNLRKAGAACPTTAQRAESQRCLRKAGVVCPSALHSDESELGPPDAPNRGAACDGH